MVAGGSLQSEAIADLQYDEGTLLVDRASREGTVVDTLDGVTVALDVTLDDALRLEGLARELVNRIQGLRKELELDLDDRIQVQVGCDGLLAEALCAHWGLISDEVLATGDAPDTGTPPTDGKAFDVDGMSASIEIARV